MNVLEMLATLENRIDALRAERTRLASALEDAERRLQKVSKAARAAKKGARKKLAKSRPKAPAAAVMEKPAPESRGTGKRQVLGRSLAQLRRLPSRGDQAGETRP